MSAATRRRQRARPRGRDLHCHSSASELARLEVQRAVALPECATTPIEVYELAKRRGMDFVTITDHDTIVGVMEIADEQEATFLGWLEGDELATTYASADLFVFPSTTDTFGQVILEAQASGLPVLAVRAGGPAELIEDGRTGCLVSPNAEELATTIRGIARRKALLQRLTSGAAARGTRANLVALAGGACGGICRGEERPLCRSRRDDSQPGSRRTPRRVMGGCARGWHLRGQHDGAYAASTMAPTRPARRRLRGQHDGAYAASTTAPTRPARRRLRGQHDGAYAAATT
ncbi:MAG: glycosyltransferase, partial [Solirubrobacteraceae bacterium]